MSRKAPHPKILLFSAGCAPESAVHVPRDGWLKTSRRVLADRCLFGVVLIAFVKITLVCLSEISKGSTDSRMCQVSLLFNGSRELHTYIHSNHRL